MKFCFLDLNFTEFGAPGAAMKNFKINNFAL